MCQNPICYTIGHSKHTIEQFVHLIQPHGINSVLDVRSIPFSRHAPQFNRSSISEKLSHYHLEYEYFGDTIGGKFTAPEYLNEKGSIDFQKAVKSEVFQKGLEKVIMKIRSGCKLALMCAEKDPLYCHRFLLISPALGNYGIKTIHLLADGSEIRNEDFIHHICNKKNLMYHQLDLFTYTTEKSEESFYQFLLTEKMKKNK